MPKHILANLKTDITKKKKENKNDTTCLFILNAGNCVTSTMIVSLKYLKLFVAKDGFVSSWNIMNPSIVPPYIISREGGQTNNLFSTEPDLAYKTHKEKRMNKNQQKLSFSV